MKVRDIPLDKIFVTKNVRFETDDELGEQIESMGRYGQLQPIGVYPRGERFELVWGHRRLRAAQMNNEATIAAHILQNISEADIPIMKLQENTVRRQLTNEEILAAAEAIKAKNPGMTDHQVDRLLGKRPGYLGFRRSLANAYVQLEKAGITKQKIASLSMTEVLELRARLDNGDIKPRASAGAYHRKGVPSSGFRITNSPGPAIVVTCSCKKEKLKVLRTLRKLPGASM